MISQRKDITEFIYIEKKSQKFTEIIVKNNKKYCESH